AWDVWRRHGGWRTRGHTGDEAAGFWNRDRAWTGDGIRRRGRDVADHDPADAVACGFELLPARRRSDPVGDLDHDAAAIGDTAVALGPGLRHQHHELRRPPARL